MRYIFRIPWHCKCILNCVCCFLLFYNTVMSHMVVLYLYLEKCIISFSISFFSFAFINRTVLTFLLWALICISHSAQILSVQLDELHFGTYPLIARWRCRMFSSPKGSLGPLVISCFHCCPQELITLLTFIIAVLISSWPSNSRITHYVLYLCQHSFTLNIQQCCVCSISKSLFCFVFFDSVI